MPMSETDSAPETSVTTAQNVSLTRLRLRPGKNALSENPIIFGAVQYAPMKLKRAIPQWLVELIRRHLAPRGAASVPTVAAAGEPGPDPSLDWLAPFFSSVGLEGGPAAVFSK